MSANALAVRRDGYVVRLRHDLPDLDGLDCALDSGGFVAWSHYGGFEWAAEAYAELAAARPWAWWAAMDACCEPKVAGSVRAVRMRQAETSRMFDECRRAALRFGASPPVPVIQGWHPADYARHVDRFPLVDWPDFVGVGSVCTRRLHGPLGLVAVLDAVDRALPRHVRVHLFGVKGPALSLLGRHPRIVSVDSQAWDRGLRWKVPVGRTTEVRTAAMGEWYRKQVGRLERARPAQLGMLSGVPDPVPEVRDRWAELVEAGEIELQPANILALCEWEGDEDDDR